MYKGRGEVFIVSHWAKHQHFGYDIFCGKSVEKVQHFFRAFFAKKDRYPKWAFKVEDSQVKRLFGQSADGSSKPIYAVPLNPDRS